MSKRVIITTTIYKNQIYDLVKDEYTVLGEYKNSTTPILMRHNCDACNNHEYKASPCNFKKGRRCPICSRKKEKSKNSNKKLTHDEFVEQIKNLVGDEYEVLGEYKKNSEPLTFKHNCDKCNNHEFLMRPSDFKAGSRCPKCKGRHKKTQEEFVQEVKNLVGNEYEVLDIYENNKKPVKFKHNCNKCNNHEFLMRPNNFISGQRCPICKDILNGLSKRKTQEEFIEEVKNLVGDEYEVLGKYETDATPILIKHNCKTCNNYVYNPTPNNFLAGRSHCPKCNNIMNCSKEEMELVEFIKTLINENDIETNNRTLLNGKELDVLIKIKKIAFEYNGLYWHSEQQDKDKNYHLDKTNECKKNNIKLIHIFSDEWIEKQDIVKSKILHILGINNKPKIYARKCVIKELTTNKDVKIKGEFLNKNHIQGNDKACIKLGLFYEDKLVSVMTFCKPRRSLGQTTNVYDYELSRFASDINYNVVGAFSKLLKYFERNYEWSKLITYADKRWSQGNVYITNGWRHLRDSKPNYWYTDGSIRIHRYTFRKQVLKQKFPDLYDEKLTEFEIMNKTKYTRIWDCGNMVFEYTR